MDESEKKRTRRTPEQMAEAIDVEITKLEQSIEKVEQKRQMLIEGHESRTAALRDKIDALRERRDALFAPRTARRHQARRGPEIERTVRSEPQISTEVVIQFGGGEWSLDALKEQAVATYVAAGHAAEQVSELKLYVKPEEHKAYCVLNGDFNSSIDLDR